MLVPVSMFIMDVRGSSNVKNRNELTEYLIDVVDQIEEWTDGVIDIKIKYRLGDEIIFLGQHFFSAFIIALYLKKFWEFKKNPPYFGVTFGMIDENVSDIRDIDIWNHRMVKFARNAVERIKKYPDIWITLENDHDKEDDKFKFSILSTQINSLVEVMSSQSKAQQIACSYFSIVNQQTLVAKILDKSPSTISEQLKNGLCYTVINLERVIQYILLSLETGVHMPKPDEKLLNIRTELFHRIGNEVLGRKLFEK